MSYACMRRYHYILLEIKLEQGLVIVLDSRRKDPETYADMTKILNKFNRSLSHHIGNFLFISWYQVIIFFVSQGLESIHRTISRTAEGAAIYIPESKYYICH